MLGFGKRRKPRSVVYTCLFGHYEGLKEQAVAQSSNVDFICLTDRSDLRSDSWQVRVVPVLGLGAARESRRPKLMPQLHLGDYDQSCYIDAHIALTVPPEEIFAILEGHSADFLCFKHPWRSCIFEEAEEVIRLGIDDETRVREQMRAYRNAGFKPRAGLMSSGFLLRRHSAEVATFGEAWFTHLLRYSYRDQLSFPFVASRSTLNYALMEFDITSNPWLTLAKGPERLPYGFDAEEYLWLNPDVAAAGMDAALHYTKHGAAEKRRWRYHPRLELDRLANKYGSDKGSLCYNRHFYTRIYEHYLQPLKHERFTLLEIGLLRRDIQARRAEGPFDDAPSLRMWADYFPEAEVHGFDLKDFSSVEHGRIIVTRGDQSDRTALAAAVAKNAYPLRVIIDDGSHASHHQQIAFGFLFRHLAPGGLYFVEDLRCQPPEIEVPTAEKTRDVLRALQAGTAMPNQYLSPDDVAYLRDTIASIEFYDSMDYASANLGADALAVIRKR